jgi:hypothetical protein
LNVVSDLDIEGEAMLNSREGMVKKENPKTRKVILKVDNH